MNRLQAFRSLVTHPWLGRLFKKLALYEFDWCVNFIDARGGLPKGEFEMEVNRLGLSTGRQDFLKLKRQAEICELLLSANTLCVWAPNPDALNNNLPVEPAKELSMDQKQSTKQTMRLVPPAKAPKPRKPRWIAVPTNLSVYGDDELRGILLNNIEYCDMKHMRTGEPPEMSVSAYEHNMELLSPLQDELDRRKKAAALPAGRTSDRTIEMGDQQAEAEAMQPSKAPKGGTHVHSKDPRKRAVLNALMEANSCTKVTMVLDHGNGTFSGECFQRSQGAGWQRLGRKVVQLADGFHLPAGAPVEDNQASTAGDAGKEQAMPNQYTVAKAKAAATAPKAVVAKGTTSIPKTTKRASTKAASPAQNGATKVTIPVQPTAPKRTAKAPAAEQTARYFAMRSAVTGGMEFTMLRLSDKGSYPAETADCVGFAAIDKAKEQLRKWIVAERKRLADQLKMIEKMRMADFKA
jgi:hypothetical protein